MVVLFQNITLKRSFYENLRQKEGSIIVFDCGAGFMDTIELNKLYVIRVLSFDELLVQLKGIMADEIKEISDMRMNTLVIENLSCFYWTLRSSKQRVLLYGKLRDLVGQLKDWYNCNVVVTSWDSEYERGYNFKKSNESPSKLQDLTFVPPEFFTTFDHVFALGKQNYKYQDSWHECT